MTREIPKLSIVFPAKNEGDHVKKTLRSLYNVQTNLQFETIVVDDHSDDGCCDFLKQKNSYPNLKMIETDGLGAANARNRGAEYATGDYLVFCDAHLTFENWWLDRLLKPIQSGKSDAVTPGIAAQENPRFIGYGQTLNRKLNIKWNPSQKRTFDTPILPGGCFMIKKEAFDHVGGFDRGFKTWGYEDIELSIKLWLFGYRCSVEPEVTVLHLFRKSHPYSVSIDDVHYNLLRMAYSHFSHIRIKKCLDLIENNRKQIQYRVLNDGVIEQRNQYLQQRIVNDDWFFNRFKIPF